MKILIEDFTFECIIGVLKKERQNPQKVVIDLILEVHETSMVIDYSKVAVLIENIYKQKKFFTVEESLLDASKALKERFPSIISLDIKIMKPDILENLKVGARHFVEY